MRLEVEKVHYVFLALILIQNLHTTCANSFFDDLATRINSMFGIHRRDDNYVRQSSRNDTEIIASPADMVRQEGYPSEIHHVTTEDGYILTIFRIPGPPGSTPVILQHGLLESSADWLIPGKGKSLAYILSDHGYDVWMGNARGNTYSRKHSTLSTSDPEFWDFSWHELGYYDLPAVINYISDLTSNSIFYIGHSMGCSVFSVMATEKPEVAKKVKAMYGLAPAIYVHHMKAVIKQISPFWRMFQRIANGWGVYEFFPRSRFFEYFSKYICKSMMLRDVLCNNSLFLIAGFNPEQLDHTLLPKIWSKFPAGTSIKLFTHWLQQIHVNEFRNFDYGLENNIKYYNSTKPPKYDLSKLRVPMAVFWSENDWLVGGKDVQAFYKEVPLKHGIYEVDDDKFNHFDFLWAVDAPKLVYSKILNLMADIDNQIIINLDR